MFEGWPISDNTKQVAGVLSEPDTDRTLAGPHTAAEAKTVKVRRLVGGAKGNLVIKMKGISSSK